MHKPILMAALMLLTTACQAPKGQGQPLIGTWGGDHVRLVLDANGGALEYDCAAGVIVGPIVLDSAGRFAAHGVHTPSHGGPQRVGEIPRQVNADYEGRVHGGRMSLSVHTPEYDIGSFTLERDATPRLFRCL